MRPSILLLLIPLAACSSDPRTEPAASAAEPAAPVAEPAVLEPASIGSMAKLHRLGDTYLGSQPSEADLEALAGAGVTTVINLRHAREVEFDEQEVVEGLGLTYVNVPFGSPAELDDEILDAGRAALREAQGPVLLHCASCNRVGAIWIAHRVLDDGIGLEDAVKEAKTAGLRSTELVDKARAYVTARKK
jgi:uncharacterized protein (TIGR01244 family)